jgi:lactoylglutathione lyase
MNDLPIVGIAGITFSVSSLANARRFYNGVLGLPAAFEIKDAVGKIMSVFFKVNDDQYIEVTPDLKPGELIRQARIVFQSSDIETLHAVYAARGLQPSHIQVGKDGNPVFWLIDPEGNKLDFLEYVAGSKQSECVGKFLDPTRVSSHISHTGLMVQRHESTMDFYEGKLGFVQGRISDRRSDYLEPMSSDLNVETKNPPLDPHDPAVHDHYVREQYGAIQHVCLEVTDIRSARDLVQARGGYDDLRVRAHVGNNRHWLVHLFDADGSRTELMEKALQDALPPMTVMAPGAPAPVIMPKAPGVLPWP